MSDPTQPGDLLFVSRKQEMRFTRPVAVITTNVLDEIPACVAKAGAAVAQGLYMAGFIAYEAAPGFDATLTTHPPGEFPLLWFGLYQGA